MLQKRGQLRACLFMGVEALVAAVRLRELSLASACSDAVCGFIGVRHSHNTLLHTVGWYLPATFQPSSHCASRLIQMATLKSRKTKILWA